MSEVFVQQLEQVAHRRTRYARLTAALRGFVVALAILVVAALVDWRLASARVGVRAMLLGATACAIAAAGWRCGRRVPRCGDALEIAWELQRLRPDLGSLVASGVEFARPSSDAPLYESLELRRDVIARAADAVGQVDLQKLAPRATLRRTALHAGAALVVLLSGAAWQPHAMRLALQRLANPWNDAQWPRRCNLEFADAPRRLLAGEAFRATLRDRAGRLLPQIVVEFRELKADAVQTQSYVAGAAQLVIERPACWSSFAFRATGDDHRDMAWTTVEVVPRPALAGWQLTVRPPAATGAAPWHVDQQPAGPVLAGSTLTWEGTSLVPLSAARILLPDGSPRACTIDPAGLQLATAESGWTAVEGGAVRLEATLREGDLTASLPLCTLSVVGDAPPVTTLRPLRRDGLVTSGGVLQPTATARDDWGVAELAVALWSVNELHAGESSGEPLALRTAEPPAAAAPGPRDWTHAEAFDVAALQLEIGTRVVVRARARDRTGQWGEWSAPSNWRVATPEQFQQDLDQRLVLLAETLAEIGQRQRAADRAVRRAANGAGEVRLGELRAALVAERDASALLGDAEHSAVASAQRLLADYAAHPDFDRALPPVLADAVQQWQDLHRTAMPSLEAILQGATRHAALRSASELADDPLSGWPSLHQRVDATLDYWTTLLESLARRRAAVQNLAALRDQQRALLAAVRQAAQAAWRDADASAAEAASALSTRQERLATDLQAWFAQEPTLDRATADAVVGAASAAATHLDQRQWALAMRRQQEVEAALAALSGLAPGETERDSPQGLSEAAAPGRRDAPLSDRDLHTLRRVADELPALVERQRALSDELASWAVPEDGRPPAATPPPSPPPADWPDRQRAVAADTRRLVAWATAAPVWSGSLQWAVEQMDLAAVRAEDAPHWSAAGAAARAAWELLQLVEQAASATDAALPRTSEEASAAGAEVPAAEREAAGLAVSAAEVRLLEALQRRLHRATLAWEAAVSGGAALAAERQAERARLARQQQRLVALMEQLAPTSDDR